MRRRQFAQNDTAAARAQADGGRAKTLRGAPAPDFKEGDVMDADDTAGPAGEVQASSRLHDGVYEHHRRVSSSH